MTIVGPELRTADGKRLELGELLGRGGEARVYSLRGEPERAVKLYLRPDPQRARKLSAMLERVPGDPDRRIGHVSIAWPESIVSDANGAPIGFSMPRVDARRYLPLHQLYHPGSRRSRAPGSSWRYLVRTARNLAGTLAALHEAGYVVGDLNESNILVDDKALVTLVDLDSIQVSAGNEVFRCTVGKAEYTPPELQERSFREVTRKPSSDRFGLAVLTFLLLMEGNHPFTGIYGGSGEPPGMGENIRSKQSPYFGRSHLQPPPAAPTLQILGPRLASLLERSLLGPAWRRPEPRVLQRALDALEAELTDCQRVPTHSYRSSLRHCPWCRRMDTLGINSFPPAGSIYATGAPPSATRKSNGRKPGSSSARAPENAAARGGATVHGGAGSRVVSSSRGPAAVSATGHGASSGAVRGNRAASSAGRATGYPVAVRGNPAPVAGMNGTAAARSPGTTPGKSGTRLGFRGSWLHFHLRLPLLSLLLLVVMAAPAVLLEQALRTLLAASGLDPIGQLGGLFVAAVMPAVIAGGGLYLLARRDLRLSRTLLLLEWLLRSALIATAVAIAADLLAGLAFGRGSVLAGDWLLLPSLWLVAFVILLKTSDMNRY